MFDVARNWPSLDLNDDAAMRSWPSTDAFNATDGLSDNEKAFEKEPALSDDDKRALTAYLKTF